MKSTLMVSAAAAVLALAFIPTADAAKHDNPQVAEQAIRSQLARYEHALNTSDTDEVMRIYADNAVFMPQNYETVVGKDNVRRSYDAIFKKIRLNVKFKIDEVKQLSANWAFARTNSSGTQTTLSDNQQHAEGNQEIFIFHRERDGSWKFYRYIFSTTNPAE
jgi:uncharacterized protein (TIGR02246 family)